MSVHCPNHEHQAEKITCAAAALKSMKESLDMSWGKHREHDLRHEKNVADITRIDGRLSQGDTIMESFKETVDTLQTTVAGLQASVAEARGAVKLAMWLIPIASTILTSLVVLAVNLAMK